MLGATCCVQFVAFTSADDLKELKVAQRAGNVFYSVESMFCNVV